MKTRLFQVLVPNNLQISFSGLNHNPFFFFLFIFPFHFIQIASASKETKERNLNATRTSLRPLSNTHKSNA